MQLIRCTQLLTLSVFLITAVGCGDKEIAQKKSVAGQVISVQGEVSATRGTQASRPLGIEDRVYSDDTVRTGDDAKVEIRFHHNGALWLLAENKERRVDASGAWRAKQQKVGRFEAADDTGTSAAGRHGNKEAAASRESLAREEPAPRASPDTRPVGEEKKSRRKKVPNRRPQPRLSRQLQPAAKTTQPQPPPQPKAPPPKASQPTASQQTMPKGTMPKGTMAKRSAKSASKPVPDIASSDAKDDSEKSDHKDALRNSNAGPEQAQLRFIQSLARSCQQIHGGTGKIRVTLRAGKVSTFQARGPSALKQTTACLRGRMKSAILPNNATVSAEIQLN